MVKQYELMILLPANFTQDQVKAFISQVEKLVVAKKGTIDSTETLGKRTLAYEIKKQREAYYVLFIISLEPSVAAAFERDIRLTDDVLRHLFITYEEKEAMPEVAVSATLQEEEKSEE